MKQRVVITGMGMVTALGNSVAETVVDNYEQASNTAFDAACVAAQRPAPLEDKAAQHARAQQIWSEALPAIVVFRNPTCGCCHKWVDHLTATI